ncbi:Sortase family protein [Corynebacterium felinum]|nr:Sortase family protein [Corynebacterium felinum]
MDVQTTNPTNEQHHHTPNEPEKTLVQKALPVLFVLIGIILLSYPLVATITANLQQSSKAQVYSKQTDTLDPELINQAREQAAIWNTEQTDGPILDPWLARVREDNEIYQHYLNQLNLTEVMATVSIPKINSLLPIYHGTEESTLHKGIGHLFGTSLPVGGESTHSVLTGHTGLSQATLWDNLIDVHEGDAVYVNTLGETMKYQVTGTEIVLPEETDTLRVEEGKDKLTLITCTPYAVNSHRLLVHAHRVPMDEKDEQILSGAYFPWQWWMTLVVAVLALVLLTILAIAIRNLRRKVRQHKGSSHND